MYTHKLSAIAIALSVSAALLLNLLHPKTRKSDEVKRLSEGTIGLVGLLTVVQVFYVTGLASPIIYRVAVPEAAIEATTFTPTNAIDPYTLSDRLFRLSYVLLLGALSGLVWLGALWKTLQQKANHQIILFLGFVAPLAGLVVLLYPSGVNPVRTIFYSEALLVILIAVCWYWPASESVFQSRKIYQYSTVVVVLLLITTAGISPIAGPDWNSTSRSYLTSEEVNAKEWGLEMVSGEIATDQYYAHETPPRRIATIGSNEGSSNGEFIDGTKIYLNRNFSKEQQPNVVYRACIRNLRSPFGVWRLTYDAESDLKKEYSQVYDSGCVGYFSS